MNGQKLPKPHIIGTAPKLTPSAHELKLALKNIQNTMGHVSDAYDAGYNLYRMIDWSDPNVTQDMLLKVILSMIGTLVLVSIVPVNYIALIGGVGIFIANTAIFKAASVTLAPVLAKKLHRRIEHVRGLIQDARAKGREPVVDVALFENQRWWAGKMNLK